MSRLAAAGALLLLAALPALGSSAAPQAPYTTSVDNGAFHVNSVEMSPLRAGETWAPKTLVKVTTKGFSHKRLTAGTVKWQIYETGVRSFEHSGNSPYFVCNNKGCDTNQPVALKIANNGQFTLTFTFEMGAAQASGDFKLVFWGVDQDHNPQDFSVTVSYAYAKQAAASRLRGAATAAPAAPSVSLDAGTSAAPVQVKITNGNFTIKKASMVPGHKWIKWGPGVTALVSMTGTTDKTILAGTVKYQIYETGSRSFISQGSSPYYTCNNKGCDPSSPIALKFNDGMSGDFTISLSVVLPAKTSASDQFTLVVWGEDQDHQPYDMDVTFLYSYAAAAAPTLVAQSAPEAALVIHHADHGLGPGGDAHCYEMTISEPTTNAYWSAHGYQYGTALWPRGPCDHKKYNFFNRKVVIAAGVTMNVYGIHSSGSMAAEVAAPEDGDYSHLYQLTNPGSPLGKQHCLELDNPGGKTSAYWADKGWKYTMPPWKFGQCDRTKFNYVNRVENNLDGFQGVTFSEFGIQV